MPHDPADLDALPLERKALLLSGRDFWSTEPVEEAVFEDGIRLLFGLAEAITTGMTAAIRGDHPPLENAELTATACLLMLQQVSYLISEDMPLPKEEMAARVADIIYAAFSPVPLP